MDASQLADLVWAGGALVLVVVILLTRRARRHGGSLRGGVVGALYEWQSRDKQRALDLIVEGKAEARRPEYPDDTVKDPELPDAARPQPDRTKG
jgi:hypothetical protein